MRIMAFKIKSIFYMINVEKRNLENKFMNPWSRVGKINHEYSESKRIIEKQKNFGLPLVTRAPLTAASNSYIVKVGGQSTILSPGSNTHL